MTFDAIIIFPEPQLTVYHLLLEILILNKINLML